MTREDSTDDKAEVHVVELAHGWRLWYRGTARIGTIVMIVPSTGIPRQVGRDTRMNGSRKGGVTSDLLTGGQSSARVPFKRRRSCWSRASKRSLVIGMG
jgi:hypothetical protein